MNKNRTKVESQGLMARIIGISGFDRFFFRRLLLSEYFVLYLCIFYFLVLLPFIPRLASPDNLRNIFSNMWPLLAVAIGQTIVLIIAGIDLSQPGIMAVTSVVGALVMTKCANPDLFAKSPVWGWFITEGGGPLAGSILAVPMGIIAMLVVGILIGLLNGIAVAKLNMPSFMVTLVTWMFFSNLAIFLTKSENVINLPGAFNAIGGKGISFIPFSLFVTGTLAVIAHILLSRTMAGRWLYAAGTNIRTSVVSGIPAKKVIIFAFMFSGFCAAAGSVLYSARLEAGRPTLGSTMLMDIIGASVIGGTSLFGGKGKVVWTLFGVLFFVLLANTLNQLRLDTFKINIVKGLVILAAAFLDVARTRLKQREVAV